jgi:hypothetical protein
MKFRSSLFLLVIALTACGGGGDRTILATSGGTVGGAAGGVVGGGSGGSTTDGDLFAFDTGLGGTGGLMGYVQRLSSVLVNDVLMSTDDADFFVEGQLASESSIREGHFVVVTGDLSALEADEVHYRSNLKGPVSAPRVVIDALTGRYEFVVLGQTVLTTAATRFEGVLAENIVQGDELEVSGPIDANGRVTATYVELKNALAEFKAIGIVNGLATGPETFDLGGLTVDYSGATLSEFEGASLADGQLVEVRMPPANFVSPSSADVTEVELLPLPVIEEGAEVEIEGFVDRFASTTDFSVNGVNVTTTGSTVYDPPGTAGQLGLNVRIEVEGVANTAGVIVADEIEFEFDEAVRVEGTVTNVTTTDGVTGTVETALGITFEIRAGTELEDDVSGSSGPFTLNDLMIGDYVEVRGYVEGSVIVASELEREDDPAPGQNRAQLRGPLTNFFEPAETVEIQGVTVIEEDGTTEYQNENEITVDRDTFFDLLVIGNSIKAEWDDFGSLSDPADDLSLEDDD